MESSLVEASYSLGFRSEDVKQLEEAIKIHHSVELIGMKRVGINNFLRFFLTHKNIPQDANHLFVLVDLNALIERELFPFWRLTFKRIADVVRESTLDSETKSKISQLFDTCIQSGDVFLTYDGARESLEILSRVGITPIIIFSRFDRLKDVITHEFFDNLQSLKDASAHKLSYVFTSYRELEVLAPDVFKTKAVSLFSEIQYIRPAIMRDMEEILRSFEIRYGTKINNSLRKEIITITGGHVQYLQLILIIYNELSKKKEISQKSFQELVVNDERIMLQSEELWESLTKTEQEILKKILAKKNITNNEKQNAKYLWDSGFILLKGKKEEIFSPLFAQYVGHVTKESEKNSGLDFTKKEFNLFNLLKENEERICDRERIVEVVWPEYKDYGVSDWSVDKLIARVRQKLRRQKNDYEIITIKTRGYKLTKILQE